MKKRISYLLVTALLALSLAACKGSTDDDKSPDPNPTTQTDTGSDAKEGDVTPPNGVTDTEPEPITFTVLSTYNDAYKAWGDDLISQEITKRTGVTLDIEYNVGDGFAEKLGMMLAAGDYPDIILSVDNTHISTMVQANALVDLSPYLENGGDNIKAAFGDSVGAMRSESDGKLYGFNKDFGAEPFDPLVAFQVSYALLEEFHYPQIDTLDQLTDYVRQYIAKYPEYNGMKNIGFMTMGSGWTFNIGFNNSALVAAGFQDDGNFYIDPETYEATIGIRTPQAKEYFKWLNGVANEGLFSLDSFSLDNTGLETELAKGNVLVAIAPQWVVQGAEAALEKTSKTPERCYAKLPIYISEDAKANSKLSHYDPMGSWKSVITDNCKDPQRAFDFFDQMWSEEMQVLVNWGIEGIHYTVENGVRVMNPEIIEQQKADEKFPINTGIGLYNYWSSGDLVKDSTGQYFKPFATPEMAAVNINETSKKVLKAYNPDAVLWRDLFPEPVKSTYGFAWKLILPADTDGALAETKVNDELRAKYVYDLVVASDDAAFDATWDTFVQKCLDAGIEKREAEVTEALKARMNLWYGK
jgi:putative aldouronate transport system substrate-binding protein